jgi:hypothetical protein
MRFIFDQAIILYLKELKKIGVLKENSYEEKKVKIIRKNGLFESVATVNVSVNTIVENPFMMVSFLSAGGKYISQKFTLIKQLNNFRVKGYRWKIVCPLTGNNCIQLFFNEGSGLFESRKSIKCGIYKIHAIKYGNKRLFFNSIKQVQRNKKFVEKMNKPYAKIYYRGMLTGTYKKGKAAEWKLVKKW